MAWLWRGPEDEDYPVWGVIDFKNSTFDSSDVLTEKPLGADCGHAIMRVKSYKINRILEHRCLPNTSSTPLVNSEVQTIIEQFCCKSEVQFYPVTVRGTDGETDVYSFAIPLKHIDCIDLERSVVTKSGWLVQDRILWGLEKTRHLPRCLGNLHLARERIFPSHVLVSDDLKEAIESLGDKGVSFAKPEDLGEVGY